MEPCHKKMQPTRESTTSDKELITVFSQDMIFTGTTVSMRQNTVPQEDHCDKAEYNVDPRLAEIVDEIQQLLDRRPVITVRVLLDWMTPTSHIDVERALPLSGYMFEDGPWKKALIKFGVDPRARPYFRYFQTITFDMSFDPILERGKYDWEKEREFTFPQLLKADDNVPHVFSGRKFVPDDNSWQICDISDGLLQSIIASSDIRQTITIDDGFFWNGTMAKLEVIMRDKLVCIRDGRTPDDEEYVSLLSFPDNYQRPIGRDYIQYGMEFGQPYTQKQSYLRGQIVARARRSIRGSSQ